MRAPLFAVFAAICLSFAGAGAARAGDGAIVGTGVGAAVGGLLGSQIGHGSGQLAATGVGIVTGGIIGNSIGESIDEDEDQPQGARANYSSYGDSSIDYQQPYAPNYVAPPAPPPQPPETYIDNNAQTYCRPYSQQIVIDGQVSETFGTACLQPDGSWHVVR